MSLAFIGEIRIMPFNYAPKGWAQCNGQHLSINSNTALFSLIGTTYGGNGQTDFALPDLRGHAVIGVGGGQSLGAAGGEELHTLAVGELPSHTHLMRGFNGQADNVTPPLAPGPGAALAQAQVVGVDNPPPVAIFGTGKVDISSPAIGQAGSGQAHENRQPYLPLNFCIATSGLMPDLG